MATKTLIQLPIATGANNADVIHISQGGIDKQAGASGTIITTGNQTISGTKTFASIPTLPASDPSTDNQATRKKYVDDRTTPTGSIIMYGGAVAPSGWALCDGAAHLRTGSGANLFAAISTTFGVGDGSTTFNVPNMQGIFARGAGSQSINGRSKGGGSLGDVNEDQGQAWQLGADADTTGARNYWGRAGNRDIRVSSSAESGETIPIFETVGQGDSRMLHAKNDGTNGDPREGATTEPSRLDLNYIIKL